MREIIACSAEFSDTCLNFTVSGARRSVPGYICPVCRSFGNIAVKEGCDVDRRSSSRTRVVEQIVSLDAVFARYFK